MLARFDLDGAVAGVRRLEGVLDQVAEGAAELVGIAVESERIVNRQIREVAGSRRTVVLTPDFETVSGLKASNRGRKPQKAWQRYRGNGEVPAELRVAVEKLLKLAQVG